MSAPAGSLSASSDFALSQVHRDFQPSHLAAHAVLTLPILAFIWLYRFLPLQDYPDWLFQGYVLFRLIGLHPLPGYSLAAFPVPNSTGTVLIALLDALFAPEVSGKIFLSMTVLLFVGGSVYLVTALDRYQPNPMSYAPLLFVCNVFFLTGYVNYVFSLSLLFVGIGYLERKERTPGQLSLAFLAVLSLLIYFSHLLSYLSWLIALSAFVGLSFDRSRFRLCGIAVLPSLLMLVWYAVHRLMAHDVTIRLALGSLLTRKVIDAARAFCLFTTAGASPAVPGAALSLLAAANLLTAALVLLLGIFWLRQMLAATPGNGFLTVSGLVYLLAFLLAPAWLGGEWWPGDRFLYPAAWIIFTSVGAQIGRASSAATKAAIKGLIVALFAVQMGYLIWFGGGVSRELARTYVLLQQDERGTLAQLCDSYRHQRDPSIARGAGEPDRSGSWLSALSAQIYRGEGVPSLRPQFHLPYYLWIERAQPALIFPTGPLLYRAGDQPGNERLGYEAMLKFGERSLCEEPAQRPPATPAR